MTTQKATVLTWTWEATDPFMTHYRRNSIWSASIGNWESWVNGTLYYIRLYTGSAYLYKFNPVTDEELYVNDKRFSKGLFKLYQTCVMEHRVKDFPDSARQVTEKSLLPWAESQILSPMHLLSIQL